MPIRARLEAGRWSGLTLSVAFAVLLVPLVTRSFDLPFYLLLATRIVIFAIAALSLDLILGYGGMASFGHSVFLGLGGYTVGIMAFHGIDNAWLQWPVALIVCATASAIIYVVRGGIDPLVAGHARVTLDPAPLQFVACRERIELLPQVPVLHGLAIRGAPVARLPRRQPLGDALAHVLRVGVHARAHRALQRLECADDRRELHAVVRGLCLGAGQLAQVRAEFERRGPAAGPGVASAGPVRVDLDDAHRRFAEDGSTSPPSTWRRSRSCRRSGGSACTRLRALIRKPLAGHG